MTVSVLNFLALNIRATVVCNFEEERVYGWVASNTRGFRFLVGLFVAVDHILRKVVLFFPKKNTHKPQKTCKPKKKRCPANQKPMPNPFNKSRIRTSQNSPFSPSFPPKLPQHVSVERIKGEKEEKNWYRHFTRTETGWMRLVTARAERGRRCLEINIK